MRPIGRIISVGPAYADAWARAGFGLQQLRSLRSSHMAPAGDLALAGSTPVPLAAIWAPAAGWMRLLFLVSVVGLRLYGCQQRVSC